MKKFGVSAGSISIHYFKHKWDPDHHEKYFFAFSGQVYQIKMGKLRNVLYRLMHNNIDCPRNGSDPYMKHLYIFRNLDEQNWLVNCWSIFFYVKGKNEHAKSARLLESISPQSYKTLLSAEWLLGPEIQGHLNIWVWSEDQGQTPDLEKCLTPQVSALNNCDTVSQRHIILPFFLW